MQSKTVLSAVYSVFREEVELRVSANHAMWVFGDNTVFMKIQLWRILHLILNKIEILHLGYVYY